MLTLFSFLAMSALGADYAGLKSFTTATAAADTAVRLIGSGVNYHQLVWTVSGTVSTCSVRVDSSVDGSTWNTGDVVSAATCTSNGSAPIATGIYNYTRINVVTKTGSGTVTPVYYVYVNNPTIVSGGGGTTPETIGTGLLSGGAVVWTGNLNFSVSPATYLIGGTLYSSPLTAITLDAADGANPRIDIIAVDDTGTAVKITGTAATPPAAPSVDPTSQIGLTFVYVAAGATTPSNVTSTNIYLENTEWTCAAGAHFDCASTSNPYAGTKDIEATAAVVGDNVTLTKPAAGTENILTSTYLVFYIRSKAAWPSPKSLLVFWQTGTTLVGSSVALDDGLFGFSSSQTTDYQQIVIPTSAFGTSGNLVTNLKFMVRGGGAAIGFYIDNVLLQSGVPVPISPNSPLHAIDFTIDGAGSAITSGDLGLFLPVNFGCVINRVDMAGSPSGSITVDVWKRAGAIPAAAQKISASAPMTLSASQLSLGGSLAGWTTVVSPGDIFGFTVATAATVQIVHGVIWCQ